MRAEVTRRAEKGYIWGTLNGNAPGLPPIAISPDFGPASLFLSRHFFFFLLLLAPSHYARTRTAPYISRRRDYRVT